MSSEYVEISIVKAEGLSVQCQSIGCYVQVDGRLHDVITPLHADNQEKEVLVPNNGLLRLIVKNMGCAAEVLGSVSFELKLLPTEGFQWLPLFCNMAKDQIFELPEEVGKNKLLILINPEKTNNIEKSPIAEEKPQNTVLLTELQEYLHKEKNRHELEVTRIESQYKGFIETLNEDCEKHKRGAKKYQIIYEDVIKELKSTKILLVEERKLRSEVQEKMAKVTQEYEENLKRANSREDSLLRMLETKDQEISQMNSAIVQLKSEVRSLEHEKQQIVDVVDEYKTELTLSNITRLNQELVLVKSLLEESELQRRKLQLFIQEAPETPTQLSSFMSPMSIGSSIDHDYSHEISENRQIDAIFEEFMRKYQNVPFKKVRENCYMIEGKEVAIVLKNGILFGKCGRNIAPMNEVIEGDGHKTHRRGVTVGIQKCTDENEEIATVRSLKSPPDSLFFQNKSILSKSSLLQTATPLRERNASKGFGKKAPFK